MYCEPKSIEQKSNTKKPIIKKLWYFCSYHTERAYCYKKYTDEVLMVDKRIDDTGANSKM